MSAPEPTKYAIKIKIKNPPTEKTPLPAMALLPDLIPRATSLVTQ